MTPRLLQESDLPQLLTLTSVAGWNQTADDWLRLLRLQPEGCFGIALDGVLAASATVLCYGNELAWIGMVLTLSDYRGQGLARRLMEHCIPFCGERAIRLDASDMGRPLYLSLGFQDECPVERWIREPGPFSKSDSAPLPLTIDWALDKRVFGVSRRVLLEDLAAFGGDSEAGGYALARPGAAFTYFGPCISQTPEATQRLLERFVSRHADEHTGLDLFPENQVAAEIARSLGFIPVRRLTRMVRKPQSIQTPDSRIFAIAGFEYG
jgi:GNAT superfamily N-acetyltransferase